MRGWIGLAAFILVYDTWAAITDRPTLSAEFHKTSREQPVIAAAGTTFVVAHLFGVVPRKVDPLCGYVALCRLAQHLERHAH